MRKRENEKNAPGTTRQNVSVTTESLPKHSDVNHPQKSNSASGFLGIDKDAQGAADRFMAKLTGNGFIMSLSKNTGKNYTEEKQARDSMAVIEFTKTEVFKNILKLR